MTAARRGRRSARRSSSESGPALRVTPENERGRARSTAGGASRSLRGFSWLLLRLQPPVSEAGRRTAGTSVHPRITHRAKPLDSIFAEGQASSITLSSSPVSFPDPFPA